MHSVFGCDSFGRFYIIENKMEDVFYNPISNAPTLDLEFFDYVYVNFIG